MNTDSGYIRRCPTCDTENAPHIMRCACGALLAGVDLVMRQTIAAPSIPDTPAAPGSTPLNPRLCPYEDCAQPNPATADSCLYCNRSLAHETGPGTAAQSHSLLNLPQALGERYRIIRPLPVHGAEAELLLVEQHAGGPLRVAKIYRHGIQPRHDVQERIARIDPRHRVDVLESGVSEGHAYELMEYCEHGSLRTRMKDGPLTSGLLLVLVRELAAAIAGVHLAGLLHRDLKPENILIRSSQPLTLVLTDFGISSVLDATQLFTGTARTLPYASPESLSGVIDVKADYWALGMIVLEGTLGAHPFAGLSEAVILHHLTTRGIDLMAVADRNIRKLLRGLLLRDPAARWGAAETGRWLANDASLAEPMEQGVASGFAAPYHIAKEICHTTEQLAVALARNWYDGLEDIANGQLLGWFRDVQKDQNAVRLLLENRYDSQMSFDVQLLKLILHLAPGVPPVWRGESIELAAILSRANLALKDDPDAIRWLDRLYQNRVLEIYAKAGNPGAADLVQRWNRACDQFSHAWDAGMELIKNKAPARGPEEYVNYDKLVYGNSETDRPLMAAMHPRLLATAYDAQWSERLCTRLRAELTGVTVHCPWLAELGDPGDMNAAALLVLESLLPEAKKAVERQLRANQREQEAQREECSALHDEFIAIIAAIRSAARGDLLIPISCSDLRTHLDRYFDLLKKIRASGRADLPWQDLSKSISRAERIASQLLRLVDTLAEQRAVNAGWLNPYSALFAGLAVILLPVFLGQRIIYVLLAVAAAVLAWRLVPDFSMTREIGTLAGKL